MINKKIVKLFILGAIFGLVFFNFFYWVTDILVRQNSKLEGTFSILANVLFFPAHLVRYTGWLYYLCHLFNSDYTCRGLGFDGGPLVWVEFVQMLAPVAILYGLLFVVIYKLIKKIKNSK